jgi:beta-N-acetylhexosaminidase
MFSSLTLEQKIGQLFFIGLPSVELDDTAKGILDEIQAGGICLFQRNCREARQIRQLLDDVRDFLPIEPILSLDQEGGLVDRLRRIIEPMPAASLLKTPAEAKKLAEITAEVVSILGFNTNFAPVVDVVDDERRKFQNGLQSRTFGNCKEDVVEFATAYLDTLQENNILGCIKHFPGLGATEIDSHEDLPSVKLNETEFYEIDQFPYRELFKTDLVKSVMVAHNSFPNLDLQETDQNGKLLPSSLSFNFITKLLREKLNFQGLVLTDDMEMGAILKNYGIGEACKMAIKAGEDMLLICANPETMREGFLAVLDAVKNGEISETRIEESLQRISQYKNLMQLPKNFDENRLLELSEEIKVLKNNLQN